MVIAAVVRNGRETIEKRYIIISPPLGVKNFARAVRAHWSTENSCHWRLHMACRENMAWLNRLVLSLLKQYSIRNSIVGKRRGRGRDDDVLLEFLARDTTQLPLTLGIT